VRTQPIAQTLVALSKPARCSCRLHDDRQIECSRWSTRRDRHVDLEHDPVRAAVIAAAI